MKERSYTKNTIYAVVFVLVILGFILLDGAFDQRYISPTIYAVRQIAPDTNVQHWDALYSTDTQQHLTTSNNSSNGPIILVWFPYFGDQYAMPGYDEIPRHCPDKCSITRNRSLVQEASVLLFHSRDLDLNDMPPVRHSWQKWVIFHFESPPHILDYLDARDKRLNNLFNWTMSYEQDSDIVAPYGHVTFQRRPSTDTTTVHLPNFSHRKKDALWFVSNCGAASGRNQIARDLQANNITVDIFGYCGNKTLYPDQHKDIPTKEFYEQYKYYLSFENTICQDYVTEKLWKLFKYKYDIVPIVLNGGRMSEMFVPEYKFIDVKHFNNTANLAKHMKTLSAQNLTNFFAWKKTYYLRYDEIYMCSVCDLIKSSKFSKYSSIKNFYKREVKDRCS